MADKTENIPQAKAGLSQHIRRTTYQGAFIWGQILQPHIHFRILQTRDGPIHKAGSYSGQPDLTPLIHAENLYHTDARRDVKEDTHAEKHLSVLCMFC